MMQSDDYRVAYGKMVDQVQSLLAHARLHIKKWDTCGALTRLSGANMLVEEFENLYKQHGEKIPKNMTDGIRRNISRVERLTKLVGVTA